MWWLLLMCLSVFPTRVINSQLKRNTFPDFEENQPLILTPYLETNQTEKARKLSRVNFGVYDNIVSFSGYFTVNKVFHSNLFFWYFPSENDHLNDPVILWLHGGPGFPSEAGLFGESGPITVKNGTLTLRDYSWTKNHSLIYIDNPVGTGYSFTDEDEGYAREETQVGGELYEALLQFFKLFPELTNNEFFLAGGSYAGKYIPAIGYVIHRNNSLGEFFINFKGVLLYNALVDPVHQVVSYVDFLDQAGLIDDPDKIKINVLQELVVKYIGNEDFVTSVFLYNVLVNEIKDIPKIGSIYNIRLTDENNNYYDSIPDWVPFIQQNETRRLLHAGESTEFTYDLASVVRKHLIGDWCKTVVPWFLELVENYRFLLYNGDLDAMIPYTSVSNFLKELKFSAAEDYKTAEAHVWTVDSEVAGYCKSAGLLTNCVVKDAGHSVPYEQPKRVADLVFKFIRNLPLVEPESNNVIDVKE